MEVIYVSMPAEVWDRLISSLANANHCAPEQLELVQKAKTMWRGTPEE